MTFCLPGVWYGATSQEMMELTRQLIRDVWPLYRELHTWARYELAARYNEPVLTTCRRTGC